jgi:hypothetical protein
VKFDFYLTFIVILISKFAEIGKLSFISTVLSVGRSISLPVLLNFSVRIVFHFLTGFISN